MGSSALSVVVCQSGGYYPSSFAPWCDTHAPSSSRIRNVLSVEGIIVFFLVSMRICCAPLADSGWPRPYGPWRTHPDHDAPRRAVAN